MENFKCAIAFLLVVFFFGRNYAEDVIECGIALKVPCKCGDQEGVQDVWAPSCKALNSTKRNNCLPCPGACEPFSKCKTCSEYGCLSCPERKFGQFCDSDEPQPLEEKTKDEAPPLDSVGNPVDENISTPKEDIGLQDVKQKLKTEAKDQQPRFGNKSPFWQTLDLLSKADREKVISNTFLRGDVLGPEDKDPVMPVTEDIGEIRKDEDESEGLSEEREGTTSKVLEKSEELSKLESLPSYRIIVEQPQPVEEELSIDEKDLDMDEEEISYGTQITMEDSGAEGEKFQPGDETDWTDFEPVDQKDPINETDNSADEKQAEEDPFSEEGVEEIAVLETTNMTEKTNPPEEQYRNISPGDSKGMPESTNESVSSSGDSIHINNLVKFPLPLNGLLKGLVKLEMLVTSLIHLDGEEDPKDAQQQSKDPAILGLSPELRLPSQASKNLLDSLTSCREHPEMQSRKLFLYMYDPHSPKIAHVHLFNISQSLTENQPNRVEASNPSKDDKTSYLSFRDPNTKQVVNVPISQNSPLRSDLPLIVNNKPPVQGRMPLPFVNALESKVEIKPLNSKPKQRIMNLDKLMNFPSIKTRHEPVLLTPDAKKAFGRKPKPEEKDQRIQNLENSGRMMVKGRPRKRVPLMKQSEKIRIKVVSDENVNEFSELLITQKKGDTKAGEKVFVPVPGIGKEKSSNDTRVRKHLFRFKREDTDWCPIQKTFRNGDLDCTIWSYQKICTLTCHPGFTAPTIYKCVPRGEWDPPLKSCLKIKKQKKANPPYRSLDTGNGESFPSYEGDFSDDEFDALMYDK